MPELPRVQILARPLLGQALRRATAERTLYALTLLLAVIAGWLAGASLRALAGMVLVLGLTLLPATTVGIRVLRRLGVKAAFGPIVAVIATAVTFAVFCLVDGLGTRVALLPWIGFIVYVIPFFVVQLGNRNPRRLGAVARDYIVVALAIALTLPATQWPLFTVFEPTHFEFSPLLLLGAVFIPACIFLVVRDKPLEQFGLVMRFDQLDLMWGIGGAATMLAITVPVHIFLGAQPQTPALLTSVVVSLAYFTVVVALAQEFIYRGLLLGLLIESLSRRRYGVTIALVASAAIFALVRALWAPNLYLVAATFVSGLVLGLLFLRTGRLGAPILASGLANALVGLMFLG